MAPTFPVSQQPHLLVGLGDQLRAEKAPAFEGLVGALPGEEHLGEGQVVSAAHYLLDEGLQVQEEEVVTLAVQVPQEYAKEGLNIKLWDTVNRQNL